MAEEEVPAEKLPAIPTQWSLTENDKSCLTAASADEATAAVVASGDFTADYRAYCAALRICPHPKILAPRTAAPKASFPWGNEDAKQAENAAPEASEDGTITDIKVKHMAVDMGSLRAFALTLPAAATITTLQFYDAGLSAEAIVLLAEALPKSKVATLAIDYNPVSATPSPFAAILKVEGTLSNVSLRGNGIDSVSGMAVAKALATNTSIGALNLFNNKLGNVGTADIAKALRFNMALKQLSIASNQVGTAGASALAELFDRIPQSADADAAREAVVASINERNAAIEAYNAEMKAKKQPILELLTIAPKELIELEEDAGSVYPGNSVLELLNLSGNTELDSACATQIADSIVKSAGMGECALKALSLAMTRVSKSSKAMEELETKLGEATCKLG